MERDMSEKSHDQMLLMMNETLLKSKAAVLFVTHTDGSVEYIRSTKDLNYIEYVGILNWVKTKMEQCLNNEIPNEMRR
jgi:hypothetical protein